MCIINKIISIIIALYFSISGIVNIIENPDKYSFSIDTSSLGQIVGNKASNANIWMMGQSFYNPVKNTENDIFEFVDYVQLMQCSGGNAERDLFKNPYDTSVLDDYDFEPLIKNCRGIILMGAKPHLKLGNVPMKYSKDFKTGEFEVNIFPPDDYNVYYNYIAALAQALVDEFGKDEVLSWRFGVMTEYENESWFSARSGKPKDTANEYCKLYDYTVAALQDVIGENVYVGAHSMSVSEGLWREQKFIRHCAVGTNYKTGKKGSRICYLSASFYISSPEDSNKGRKSLPDMFRELRSCAEFYGLKNLNYGVDEGRILEGTASGSDSSALMMRAVGYGWQAAFDARNYGQMIDNNIEYFSYWGFFSGGLMNGNPTVSYHVAKNISEFRNSNLAKVKTIRKGHISKAEIKTYSAFDKETNILHIMSYNYKNDYNYDKTAKLNYLINAPQFSDGQVRVKAYIINDDCNYFDEWIEDRKTYGITDDCFSWSPDDGNIEASLQNPEKRQLYFEKLNDKYKECSVLKPVGTTAEIKNGQLELNIELGGNEVVFYEISR